MRRLSLGLQVFLSMFGVSLVTALIVGFFARTALSNAFDRYLASLGTRPGMMQGRGLGRMMLGSAEQAFVASVDRSVIGAALLAIAIAAVVALLLAAYLNSPLKRLESAAEVIAEGDLSHRVEVEGPHEVAALGDAFNRMADSLEGAEELRRKMVADVAHELRNPLAAARAQAEGMSDGIIPVNEARLDSLVDDLQHLSLLIDDLQELAVAEAGRLRYDMRQLDLSDVLSREAEHARPLLHTGVKLHVALGSAPVLVEGDERRLAQVVRNLLSNAARHTRDGSITLELEHLDGRATIRVSDTGEGISAEDLPHIFERFYRADASRASQTGGAGLGLAISRSIVRDHGGEVFAESEVGRGTVLGFSLPAA
ncbi:MAG TPA: HAMP domain-containing sensor histidine kinase [Coriobacteriia bacterium]|nr:HAMP domain-containing sensor histidine kinase [Coriobacteriia bacterium]